MRCRKCEGRMEAHDKGWECEVCGAIKGFSSKSHHEVKKHMKTPAEEMLMVRRT